jgi:putative Holliday junction resolvase
MARILAIDYGKKRTGLAVTDELQIIAGGLTTVATTDLIDYILDYVKRENVERIIVGLPKKMNNEYSENMVRIEPFVNRLRKLLPDMPVEYHDERFTSVLAHQAILASGIGKMARRNKELVDEVSATIILQSYMEHRRMTFEKNKLKL